MNPSVAALLAALLGGALSIAGGFAASLYASTSADRLRRRQELRNMLEQAYKLVQAIDAIYFKVHYLQHDDIAEENREAIADALRRIAVLVEFYMPPLEPPMATYRRVALDLMIGTIPDPNDFQAETRRVQASIVQLYRAKGYGYFPDWRSQLPDATTRHHSADHQDQERSDGAVVRRQSSEGSEAIPDHPS